MSETRSVRAELERKKIQLALMKQKREQKLLENLSHNPENRERLDDVDSILHAVGISPALSRASTAPVNVSSMDQSRLSATSPDISVSSVPPITQQQQQQQQQHFQSTPQAPTPLEVVHVNQINIPPKERVYYTKSTQTAPSTPPQIEQVTAQGDAPQQKSYYGKQNNSTSINPIAAQQIATSNSRSTAKHSSSNNTQVAGPNQLALEWDDEFPVLTYQDEEDEQSSDFISNGRQSKSTSTGTTTGLPQVEMVRPANGQNYEYNDREETTEATTEIREMNEDERRQIESREDYQQFITRATKVLERALYHNESPDIFIQYFPDGSKGAIDSDRKSGNKLCLNRIFFDEKWSKNRCVTSFDWSAQYPELLLASYFTNEQAPSDPDGTLLVWNMKFKNTSPEYIFHCQSPIMSCCFAKFHPSLIVGGTYSGQIVLWDMRSNKKTPVQRSPLTAAAHTHPLYCAEVVGTQNAHNLISVSTDGKLCSWSLDMLSAPQETLELNQQKQTRPVAVTCMSFHPDDYNNFLVGSEDGTVYSACRHGSKTGILSSFESHQGFITNVDYRPNDTQAGYSHLFLTSSIDWTVKLWDSKESEPIHSFESNGDYVYDVKWSPTSPALFATADGDGRLDIWNLANDSELPTASTQVEPSVNGESLSLNKLIWTPSGNQVVVGDQVGRIHVYDTGDVGDIGTRRQDDKWKLRSIIA